MAGVGGAGWHDGFGTRLLGELNGYVRSRFVSQKFIAYIAEFNKADMIDPGRSHAVRKDDAGHRSDLQIE